MTAIEKSILTPTEETRTLAIRWKAAASKAAGETLECLCSKGNYPSTLSDSTVYYMERFFVWFRMRGNHYR